MNGKLSIGQNICNFSWFNTELSSFFKPRPNISFSGQYFNIAKHIESTALFHQRLAISVNVKMK